MLKRRERSISKFALSAEIIIGTIMFFLGVYASRKMEQAAEQSVLQYQQGRIAPRPRRRWYYLRLVVSILAGAFLLSHIPEPYLSIACLSFAAGMIVTIIVFVVQKVRYQH